MADTRTAKLRRLWLNVHLWIGVGLAVLLIPISVSGGLLVWNDDIDALLNPQRYAVTGPQMMQPPSAYLTKAAESVAKTPGQWQATSLRYPDEPGLPARVTVRGPGREGGGRPSMMTVYLDPPTASVLGATDFRGSFMGFLHSFHENLTMPQYNGRQIVGWAGAGMLILSLTGIWLWWPRKGGFIRGLRWTRSSRFTFNLHHLLGLWISIPLAVVSATGIYLAFPQTARNAMSSVATMNPQGPRGFFGEIAQNTALTADRAVEIAQQVEPNAKPAALFLPTEQRGERARGPSWRVQMQRADGDAVTVAVDDRSGKAAPVLAPQSGDRAASWIRWIHEGSHSGPVWALIVFLTGVFPTIFAITGTIMWLRKRADKKALEVQSGSVEWRPAE
ncbi:MAG TPA: PepSY-associated TM helix domain-containing protein [Pseudolabrys sp.]|nr:PepSY-associated TM helix domain-containing protein [Pseudolabrys sp.]